MAMTVSEANLVEGKEAIDVLHKVVGLSLVLEWVASARGAIRGLSPSGLRICKSYCLGAPPLAPRKAHPRAG